MSLRERTRPGLGIIEPCLPSPAKAPPAGPGWLHEIKHDGFRIMARRDAVGVRLIARYGKDFTHRFPFIAVLPQSALFIASLYFASACVRAASSVARHWTYAESPGEAP
jgi:hypothetical protein